MKTYLFRTWSLKSLVTILPLLLAGCSSPGLPNELSGFLGNGPDPVNVTNDSGKNDSGKKAIIDDSMDKPVTAKFVPGRVLAKFCTAAKANSIATEVALQQVGVQRVKEFRHCKATLLKVNVAKTVEQVIKELRKSGLVEYAEPDYYQYAFLTPNDPQFPNLWGMNNIGQGGGTVDADIDAPEAWDIRTSAQNIVVGVIDTGVDYNHEDLAANMWTNPEDGTHGFNSLTSTNDPMDDHGHGTHVSGTIGGVGNNGIGVAGVCWQVQIMGLKFLDSSGSGSTSNAITCLEWAIDHGANLTSNSWGGGGYSQALYDAIAASGNAGMLFVAAAGNAGRDNDLIPNYPSNYDLNNIIAVAATDRNDALASFSCYGATSVDLSAPGAAIISLLPNNQISPPWNGTSMATPHVSGACALLKARHPDWSVGQLKACLLANTDPIPALQGKCVSGGRLNLFGTLQASLRLVSFGVPRLAPVDTPYTGQFLAIGGTAPYTYQVTAGNVPPELSLDNLTGVLSGTPLQSGSYTFTVTVTDAASGTSSDTVTIEVFQVDEDFETGDFNRWPWSTGGDAPWFVATDSAHSQTHAAKSGQIGDSQSNYLEVTLTRGEGAVSFFRRVSSESSFDYLRFKIDGVEQASWSGEVSWNTTALSYPVSAGTHTYRWEYTKDSSLSIGMDAVWIDDITFPPLTTEPALSVNPARLNFSAIQNGANPPSQALSIRNTGIGSFNWTATKTADWLTLSPTSGSCSTEIDNVTVSCNITGLAVGTYTDNITVTAPGAVGSPRIVPVTLTVNPPGGTGSLTTLFTSDNGYAGNMFDVQVNRSLTILGFDVNLSNPGSTNTVSVYYRLGTSVGHETSSSGWTLVGTDSNVVSSGTNAPTHVNIGGLSLEPGQVYGFYVDLASYGSTSMNYTNGGPTTFSNADMSLTTNCGNGTPAFTSNIFYPRQWNGTIYYTGGGGFTVTAITPDHGCNNTVVNITDLVGTGFQPGATVALTRAGQAPIPATGVNVDNATHITCTFNLSVPGNATGAWDVVVTNPDNQTGTLAGGFTIAGPPTAPANPDPADNAQGVSVDTMLSWNGGGGSPLCVVVPNVCMTTEGDSNNAYPFDLGSGSMRYQQIYTPAEVGHAGVITQIRFRPDGGTGNPFSASSMNVEIFLGYAATSVSAPSSTFASNIGTGYIRVYQGTLTLSSADAGGPPRNFDIVVDVDDVFFYDPANGPLLLDIKMLNSSMTTAFDAHGYSVSQNATTRIYSPYNGSVNDPTGIINYNGTSGQAYGLVTMFCFNGAVPSMNINNGASNHPIVNYRDYTMDRTTGVISVVPPVKSPAKGTYNSGGVSGAMQVTAGPSALATTSGNLIVNSGGGTGTVYDVYFGTDPDNLTKIADNISGTTCDPTPNNSHLAYDTRYYWQVVTRNGCGPDAWGEKWSFVTEKAPVPTVTGITPNHGCNNTVVNITDLVGTDFQPGATVALTRAGQTPIPATGVNVDNATHITCTFNLSVPGDATGAWDVVVTNPDNQTGTLVGGFTIAGAPAEPANPDPPTDALGVPVGTNLSWNGGSAAQVVLGENDGSSPGTTDLSLANAGQIDITTGRFFQPAPKGDPVLRTNQVSSSGGRVLWDLTHGVYLGYSPSGSFSNLASVLQAKGFTVETTTAGVDHVNLSSYQVLVIVAGSAWNTPYSSAEISAITTFVSNGGGLLVMAENNACPNYAGSVAEAFGVSCAIGSADGYFSLFSGHAIFTGCSQIYYAAGGGLTAVSPGQLAAWASDGVTGTVAVSSSGSGRVVVTGDMNWADNGYLALVNNQRFVENIFDWLPQTSVSITYDVYFGTDPDNLTKIADNISETTCDPTPNNTTLLGNTTYYWRVVARNACGETWGPVWSFTTADTLPVITAWYSVVGHGTQGDGFLNLDDTTATMEFVEPRYLGTSSSRLVVAFSKAIDPASFTTRSVLILGKGTAGTVIPPAVAAVNPVSDSGNTRFEIVLNSPWPNQARYKVALAMGGPYAVKDMAGNPLDPAGPRNPERLAVLQGDCTGNGSVNNQDVTSATGCWPYNSTLVTFDILNLRHLRADVVPNGSINNQDITNTNGIWPQNGKSITGIAIP